MLLCMDEADQKKYLVSSIPTDSQSRGSVGWLQKFEVKWNFFPWKFFKKWVGRVFLVVGLT